MLILHVSMECWIGAYVETPDLVQPLVKTLDRQHEYAAAFAPTLKAFEGLELTKKAIKLA